METDYEQRLAREARRWARLAERTAARPTWLDSDVVKRHVNRLVSGDEELHWTEAIQRRYLPQGRWGGRGLTLGCNDGRAERFVLRTGVCAAFDALDISEEAVSTARELARAEGLDVRYEVADVNALELPRDAYALVLAVMSLHHFERLEHVFDEVHAALRRDGVFVFDEFVGPTRFRWTDEQLHRANELRAELPPELRLDPEGRPAGPVGRPEPASFDRDEPFEAIRSAEILPLALERFRVLARRDYGGTVLQLALDGLLQNFDERREEHRAILRELCAREQHWIARGELPSDFTIVVAARRDTTLE